MIQQIIDTIGQNMTSKELLFENNEAEHLDITYGTTYYGDVTTENLNLEEENELVNEIVSEPINSESKDTDSFQSIGFIIGLILLFIFYKVMMKFSKRYNS